MGQTGPEAFTSVVPTEVVQALQEGLPELVDAVIEQISSEIPAYADVLRLDRADTYRVADNALHQLIALASGRHRARRAIDYPEFVLVGQIEAQAGRSLQELLSTYRLGGRLAWRHIASVATNAGLSAEGLARLAEAVFGLIDELSAASARGYAEEESMRAGMRDRRLTALAELLLTPRADAALVEAAATEARWVIPDSIAIVLAPRSDGSVMLDHRLTDALPFARDGRQGALLPDIRRRGQRTTLMRALRGTHAAVTSGHWKDVPHLLPHVELALDLIERGRLPDSDPVFVEDHLADLVLHRDARLSSALAKRALAPLADVPSTTRMRLLATLRVWLEEHGDRQQVARRLHIHPQTVRYRVGQLRKLFGDRLDDARTRTELEMAVHIVGADVTDL